MMPVINVLDLLDDSAVLEWVPRYLGVVIRCYRHYRHDRVCRLGSGVSSQIVCGCALLHAAMLPWRRFAVC